MNDDKHVPTDEFVEYLARDTMRRLRHETRFAPPGRADARRSRIATLGMAAGMVFTLSTGMVLGASANYASAEVLPNGTTTIPTRPTLAILPIRNALTAIGCTQPAEHASTQTAVGTTSVPSTAQATATAAATHDTELALHDSLAIRAQQPKPNRAQIALLAKQHQAAVVRGDSVSDYVVMVLDAGQNYLWSTHGNGNVSIDVGGDTRTAEERSAYNRANAEELMGKFSNLVYGNVSGFSSINRGAMVSRDSQPSANQSRRVYYPNDSTQARGLISAGSRDSVRYRNDSPLIIVDGVVVSGGGNAPVSGGRGGGRVMVDSTSGQRRWYIVPPDSAGRNTNLSLSNATAGGSAARNLGAVQGCGRSARIARRSGEATSDSLPNIYSIGFLEPRFGVRCNLASGMQEAGAGQSGVTGLAPQNVSRSELYMFAAGELAPRDLKVMVVYLTPGTLWSGR